MPVSLEVLDLSGTLYSSDGTPHEFTGGIPAEWISMTNLKELKMANCGLDGESAFPVTPRRSEFRSETRQTLNWKAETTTRARAGTVPAEMRSLINLEILDLWDNRKLQRPKACPDGDMCYESKVEVAAFLRCL